jgi:hypothetical protein
LTRWRILSWPQITAEQIRERSLPFTANCASFGIDRWIVGNLSELGDMQESVDSSLSDIPASNYILVKSSDVRNLWVACITTAKTNPKNQGPSS